MNKFINSLAILVVVSGIFVSLSGLGISNPHVELITPQGGEVWRIGSTQQIFWYGVELQGPYKVEIQRRPRGRWQTIQPSFQGGFFDWTVTGPSTSKAIIRVTDINTGKYDQNDLPFSIVRGRSR